ncbi:hypothetical protein Prudu_002546 [Prunus dulcis]|uniref:Uncharacterized protein n=1 Tax=Prunus dulcis TaxID=3755 RepID=A0A4Y1QR39_PRUDU|nr:hypothetical protein Prudu_002546 [Prunus dulcis]
MEALFVCAEVELGSNTFVVTDCDDVPPPLPLSKVCIRLECSNLKGLMEKAEINGCEIVEKIAEETFRPACSLGRSRTDSVIFGNSAARLVVYPIVVLWIKWERRCCLLIGHKNTTLSVLLECQRNIAEDMKKFGFVMEYEVLEI